MSAAYPWPDSPTSTPTAWSRLCIVSLTGPRRSLLLRGREDAFHVFVYAPCEEKIRRVRMSGKSEEEAVELVSQSMRNAPPPFKNTLARKWANRHLYHLTISSKIGDDLVVRAILNEGPALQ
jgi:Cytidylate kinase-like family